MQLPDLTQEEHGRKGGGVRFPWLHFLNEGRWLAEVGALPQGGKQENGQRRKGSASESPYGGS